MNEHAFARRFRVEMTRALDPTASGGFAGTLHFCQWLVVAIGLMIVILGTDPSSVAGLDAPLTAAALVIAAIFCVEYAMRIAAAAAAGESDDDGASGGWRRRVTGCLFWVVSPLGLIDLAAAAAVPVSLALGADHATVRLFGVLWVLKLVRYTPAVAMLLRVLRNERQPLLGVMVAFLIVILLAGTAQYLLERQEQPETFASIPSGLWWSVVTLTTTGYGDKVPGTPAGRMLAAAVMVCGIGMFALWAGILANGFSTELRRHEFLKTWDLVAKVPLFRSVGAGTIAEVTRLLRPEHVAGGRIIVRKGAPGDCMYFIAEGEVEVRARPQAFRLGAGTFFGEMALITGAPRTATVTAAKSTMLLRLDIVDFRELAASRPELAEAIRAEAARRLEGATGATG